jgi:hypothetical protein
LVCLQVLPSGVRKHLSRPASPVVRPQQPRLRLTPERCHVSSPYRPAENLGLEVFGWIQENAVGAGFQTEMTDEHLAESGVPSQ